MKNKYVVLFMICFYTAWTLKEIVSAHFLLSDLEEFLVKICIWVVPVFCYLYYVDRIQNPFSYLKMTGNVSEGIKWGVIVGAVLIFVEAMIVYLAHTRWHFDIGQRWVYTPLFAFPEELVFRGFVLQRLAASMKFVKANLIATALFVCVHFPIWFVNGTTLPKLIGNVLMVFVVGYGLGYLFKRTNSLWSSTIVHSIYNLLIYVR